LEAAHVNYDSSSSTAIDKEVARGGDNQDARTGTKQTVERVRGTVRAGTDTLTVKKVHPSDPGT